MSVVNMKRLTVLAHKENVDDIIKRLLRLKCVEISDTDSFEDEKLSLVRINCDAERQRLEASVADIARAIDILDAYAGQSKGLLTQRARVNIDSFLEQGHSEYAKKVVAKALETDERIARIATERMRAEADIAAAEPYVEYDLPLGFSQTERADVILGVLPAATDLDTVGKELYAAGAVAQLLKRDKNGLYASFFCHKNDSRNVNAILASYGFLRASFAKEDRTAKEFVEESIKAIARLDGEEVALRATLADLAESIDFCEVLYDIEATELRAVNEKLKLAATDSVAIISGWCPEPKERAVEALLEKYECAYAMDEPTEEDKPPILLKNNRFASNFEWVLGMYSYPAYGKFDPTLIMSIFYLIIFGIMFADAGYGLLLVLAGFGAVKLLKPSESMERFFKMFAYCGFSCIVFGVLFGSYFGDLPLAIMTNMMGVPEAELPDLALWSSGESNIAVLLDPMQNPMGFLLISLGVGAVHLIAGMAVRFVLLCKEGKALDAVLDIGAYWVLFAGIALLFVDSNIGMWTALAGVAIILLTHGRKEKNIVMKLVKGLLGLYDLVSYASDLLSYSRILALGLASAVIAKVVNILGTMSGPTVMGFVILVLAFVVGHLLNVAINVLGTFVHTSRLQYIEFFGRFYEDGGTAFEPVTPSERYCEHTEEQENTEKIKKSKKPIKS